MSFKKITNYEEITVIPDNAVVYIIDPNEVTFSLIDRKSTWANIKSKIKAFFTDQNLFTTSSPEFANVTIGGNDVWNNGNLYIETTIPTSGDGEDGDVWFVREV